MAIRHHGVHERSFDFNIFDKNGAWVFYKEAFDVN